MGCGRSFTSTNDKAGRFARALKQSDVVERVLHPALSSCPGHEFWQRDIGGSAGVFSVVLRPGAEAGADRSALDLRGHGAAHLDRP